MKYENESDPSVNWGHLNAVDFTADTDHVSAEQAERYAYDQAELWAERQAERDFYAARDQAELDDEAQAEREWMEQGGRCLVEGCDCEIDDDLTEAEVQANQEWDELQVLNGNEDAFIEARNRIYNAYSRETAAATAHLPAAEASEATDVAMRVAYVAAEAAYPSLGAYARMIEAGSAYQFGEIAHMMKHLDEALRSLFCATDMDPDGDDHWLDDYFNQADVCMSEIFELIGVERTIPQCLHCGDDTSTQGISDETDI